MSSAAVVFGALRVKIGTPKIIIVIVLKKEKLGKDSKAPDGMSNNVHLDQTVAQTAELGLHCFLGFLDF